MNGERVSKRGASHERFPSHRDCAAGTGHSAERVAAPRAGKGSKKGSKPPKKPAPTVHHHHSRPAPKPKPTAKKPGHRPAVAKKPHPRPKPANRPGVKPLVHHPHVPHGGKLHTHSIVVHKGKEIWHRHVASAHRFATFNERTGEYHFESQGWSRFVVAPPAVGRSYGGSGDYANPAPLPSWP